MSRLIKDYLTENTLDTFNKIVNLEEGGQISEEVKEAAEKKIKEIDSAVLDEIKDCFPSIDDYDNLYEDYMYDEYGDKEFDDLSEKEKRDIVSVMIYNNDWLYKCAIARVLGLEEPDDCDEYLSFKKTYSVGGTISIDCWFEIEANSKEEAKELTYEQDLYYHIKDALNRNSSFDFEVYDVQED